NMGSKSQN
ncbi:hypothetical protein LK397_pgp167, partial (chloroplast) [Beta vulgaris subsp. vulgaris]